MVAGDKMANFNNPAHILPWRTRVRLFFFFSFFIMVDLEPILGTPGMRLEETLDGMLLQDLIIVIV